MATERKEGLCSCGAVKG